MSTSVAKERPIIFSGPMVKAILDGRKTQTRRVAKPQPQWAWGQAAFRKPDGGAYLYPNCGDVLIQELCPYGIPGDRLWVRETWGYRGATWCSNTPGREEIRIGYQADDSALAFDRPDGGSKSIAKQNPPSGEVARLDYFDRYWKSWRPSIFLPRWASRITLEITDVRVQRVQEISEEDAEAEGAFFTDYGWNRFHQQQPGWAVAATSGPEHCLGTARFSFGHLWDSINAKRGFGWDTNPWVWAITFRRESK